MSGGESFDGQRGIGQYWPVGNSFCFLCALRMEGVGVAIGPSVISVIYLACVDSFSDQYKFGAGVATMCIGVRIVGCVPFGAVS